MRADDDKTLASTSVSRCPSPPPPEYEIVAFHENDPDDPTNWSTKRKNGILTMICLLGFAAVFGSSSYAPGTMQIRMLYGVSDTVASLGVALYVAGFGIGPLFSGPITEMYGKRKPYLISWALLIATTVPSAFAENLAVILVFRFLSGVCASCPLNTGASVIADLYIHDLPNLGKAVVLFSTAALQGPVIGSLVGFFIAAHSGRQLWVIRVHFFFCVALIPLVLLFPETYPPEILLQRAKRMRKEGKTNARAAHELHGKTTMQVVQGHVFRPMAMIIREPIVQGSAAWISLGYGIIYFFFQAFPIVFIKQHGIPFQLCGLLFIGVTLGMLLAVFPYAWLIKTFRRLPLPGIDKPGNETQPESTLKVVLTACVLLPASMFWFAWASGPETHWIVATLAGIPFGYSSLMVFFAFLSYNAHTYGVYASSAGAANTFVRSLVAASFPLFATPMLEDLGTKWGISVFGFLSVFLLPIPLIYIRYGEALRARSHFAREARELAAGMHHKHKVPEDEKRRETVEIGEV
ncbi:unnamed protein product [Somion occarium]|uniref:Major facilitator superfamily (MFS) profile domain-containing protein n=1 Tax=Somion occarium TaxID=3059160 RepID=A0ABP1DT48_9APHY